jgi:hypothetical protein
VSSRVIWCRARHPPGEGSDVATCPKAPSPSPDRRRLKSHHVPRGSRSPPYTGRLWRCHMTEESRPRLDRAPVPPCVMWLQTHLLVLEGSRATMCPVALDPRAYPCVRKMSDIRPMMASTCTRYRQRIKCICDRPYATYGKH